MQDFGLLTTGLTGFLSAIAAGGAASSLAATLNAVRELRASVASTREKLESAELKDALREGGVTEVGDLLLETLGDVSIVDYVADAAVSARVDGYVARIIDYLGTDQSVAEEAAQVLQLKEGRADPDPKAVEAAVARYSVEVPVPEPWMHLAKVRRDIEISLREVIKNAGLEIPELASAGRLLGVLRKHGLIHPMVYDDLRIATSLANQALHGASPTEDEADEAVYLATRALDAVRRGAWEPRTYPYGAL